MKWDYSKRNMIIYMYIYIIIYLLVEERECGVQTPNTKFFSKKKKKTPNTKYHKIKVKAPLD